MVVGEFAVTTAADGRFAVKGLGPGLHDVLARALGFAPYRTRIDVTNGAVTRLEVVLTPRVVRLDPVTVEWEPILSAPSIGHAELVQRGRTLAEALDGWQSILVRTQAAGTTAPVIRGSAPDEVLVLVDGVPLNDPTTGVADLSRVGVDEVHRVTLYPGAQRARFGGRALAGVLVIDTRPGGRSQGAVWGRSHGAVGASGVLLLGSRTSLRIEAERMGDAFAVDLPINRGGGQGIQRNADFRSFEASARTVAGPVALMARAETASRGLPGTISNPSVTARGSSLWLQNTVRIVQSDWAVGVLAEVARTTFRDTMPPAGLAYDDTTWVGSAAADARWRGLRLGGRVDRLSGSTVRDGRFTVGRAHVSGEHTWIGSIGELAWRLTPQGRFDVWTTAGSPAVSLRLDAAMSRGPWSGAVSIGSSAAPPVTADLIFREGVGVRINADLEPERVPLEIEGMLGWLAESHDLLALFQARAYTGRVDDLVLWAPDFRFVWSPDNFDVRRSGVELAGRLEIRSLYADLSTFASFTSITYARPDGPQVIYRPRGNQSVQLTITPPLFRLRVAWRRMGERFPNHGGVNALEPESILDLSLATELMLGRVPLELIVSVHDVLDTRPQFIAGYPTRGRSFTLRVRMEAIR